MQTSFNLTTNVVRVMDFLVRNFEERYSINKVAESLQLSPMGAYKILKSLEEIDAIIPEKIGNAIYYRPNWQDELAKKFIEFIMMKYVLSDYAQIQADDFQPLKKVALAAILFGSVLTKGKDARDIDILLIFNEENFGKVNKMLEEIKKIKPKPIHKIIQTPEDIRNSIQKKDPVIFDAIKKGKVLWGSDVIVEAIKHGTRRQ